MKKKKKRNYKKRPESLASQIWNAVRNDNTPDDKKYLGVTSREVKNPETWEQYTLCMDKIHGNTNHKGRYYYNYDWSYKEYYIPYDWIGDKKYQLNNRLHKHVVDLL